MDTTSAFMMGQANRGRERMVFDWAKAARLIKERNPQHVVAGLESDMEWTGGPIWSNGAIVADDDTYTYLASTWATPLIVIDGEDIPCYVMASETQWDESTYWPEEARSILGANAE
jgi:hypothetical protein